MRERDSKSQLAEHETKLPDLKMAELEKLEKVVREGMHAFREVGEALLTIRDRRGYALRGFKSFSDYCEKQWGFSERHGLRLMSAAETAQKVERAVGVAPRNEAAARVLGPIAGDSKLLNKVKDRLAAKKLDVATATAEVLQDVVDRIKPQSQAMFADDKPKPIAPIAGLSDICPACKKVPGVYIHSVDGWKCGECKATVRVGALPLELAVCTECGAPIIGDAGFCAKCGTVQK